MPSIWPWCGFGVALGGFGWSVILHPFRQASSGPVCPGIALLLAHCLAARPLPPAYALGHGAKPPENWQNLPIDALHQVWQNGAAMNESEKQFSFTRAASSTSGRAKNQISNALKAVSCQIVLCFLSGCMMGNIIGPTTKTKIIEKTTTPDKKKSVGVLVLDRTHTSLPTLERAEYLADQKKYYSEALQKIGITDYEFIGSESVGNLDKDYLLTIEVEEARAFAREADSITTRIEVALVVSVVDKKTNSLVAKIAGTADNDQWGYNINKFISNLLKEMLQKIYQ